RTSEEHRGTAVARVVQNERGILAPRFEESGTVPGSLETLQPVARNDLVGVDVGAREWQRSADDVTDRLHQRRSDGDAKCPAAARRSSSRAFEQDPINTASTRMSRIGVPGVRSW